MADHWQGTLSQGGHTVCQQEMDSRRRSVALTFSALSLSRNPVFPIARYIFTVVRQLVSLQMTHSPLSE